MQRLLVSVATGAGASILSRMFSDRTWRRFMVGLAVALLSGCDRPPEGPGVELFEALARGGFIEHGRLLELGRLPTEPVKYDSSFWAPLPLIAGEGWSVPSHFGWHPIGAHSTMRYLGATAWLENPLLQLKLHRLWELQGEVRVEVRIEGSVVGEIVLASGLPIPSLPVPTELLADDMLIELSFDPPVPEVPRGDSAHVALTASGSRRRRPTRPTAMRPWRRPSKWTGRRAF